MNLRNILNNSKIGLAEKANAIKTYENPNNYFKFFQKNKILNQFVSRNLFPNKLEGIKLNEPFTFTNDFEREFLWTFLKIQSHTNELKSFYDLKLQIENHIILDNS